MFGHQVSIIFLPTYECNAQCTYCFETKKPARMSLADLSIIFRRICAYLSQCRVKSVDIYWQGGEVMVLPPDWCLEAGALINSLMGEFGLRASHYLQTNLMDYSPQWDEVIFSLFHGTVGSSLDYPNMYRHYHGLSGERYNERWRRNYREALASGVDVSVITLPNRETLSLSPVDFYEYFVEKVGLPHFQVNTPFPGGPASHIRGDLLLDSGQLGRFLVGLLDVWLSRDQRITIAPFQSIAERMVTGEGARVPCFFCSNCVHGFFCLGPTGEVGQCDCWISSYPEKGFGNVLDCESMDTIFQSPNRLELANRVSTLIRSGECVGCAYFALCSAGCPVRAMSVYGSPHHKDPYCDTYKSVFAAIEERVHAQGPIRKRVFPAAGKDRTLQWGWSPPGAIAFCSFECTNNCIFCGPAKSRAKNTADLDEEMFGFISRCAEQGIKTLFFSGAGEPTLNPRLVDYVRFAKASGIPDLFMFTNGSGVTEALVAGLQDAGMDNFWVSLHGIGETHDRVVRRKGSFKEAYRALLLIDAANPGRLNVNTCLNMLNIDQIELLCDKVLAFPNTTAHCLCLPEWDGNAYLNRARMCRLDLLKERLSTISPQCYPLTILDNVPHCVAPHLPHIDNCDYSLLIRRGESEQAVGNADNMGHNIIPEICSHAGCRYLNVCTGVDARYVAEYGVDEVRAMNPKCEL